MKYIVKGGGEFYILKTFDTLQFYSRNYLIINYLYYNSAILIFQKVLSLWALPLSRKSDSSGGLYLLTS